MAFFLSKWASQKKFGKPFSKRCCNKNNKKINKKSSNLVRLLLMADFSAWDLLATSFESCDWSPLSTAGFWLANLMASVSLRATLAARPPVGGTSEKFKIFKSWKINCTENTFVSKYFCETSSLEYIITNYNVFFLYYTNTCFCVFV